MVTSPTSPTSQVEQQHRAERGRKTALVPRPIQISNPEGLDFKSDPSAFGTRESKGWLHQSGLRPPQRGSTAAVLVENIGQIFGQSSGALVELGDGLSTRQTG